jgi:ABC-type antimicrobial peptide transport system permease subunit
MVLGDAARLALAGVALGLPGTLVLGRVLASSLFGVVTPEPLLLGAISLLLPALGLAGAWLPARRAARLDPAAALLRP